MLERVMYSLADVIVATEVIMAKGRPSRKAVKVTLKRGEEICNRVRGNRSLDIDPTWDDMRLLAQSIFQDCLRRLESDA